MNQDWQMDEFLYARLACVGERFREHRMDFTPEMGFPQIHETDRNLLMQCPEEWSWVREELGESLAARLLDWQQADRNYYWVGQKDRRTVGMVIAEPRLMRGEDALEVYFAFRPEEHHLYEEAELYASYPVTCAQELGIRWLKHTVTDPGAWYIRGLEDQGFVPCDFDDFDQPQRFEMHVQTPAELSTRWNELVRGLQGRPILTIR